MQAGRCCLNARSSSTRVLQAEASRPTDAYYSDGRLDLAEHRLRRELVQAETDAARERLAVLDQPPVQPPTPAELKAFAQCWVSQSVEERRRTIQTLLVKVKVRSDKSVRLYPRWGSPVTVAFTDRGRVPHLPDIADA